MIWSSRWYESRKVPGIRYQFVCDGIPVDRLDLAIEGMVSVDEKWRILQEATKQYPMVVRECGEAMGAIFEPHPDPFHVEVA